MYNKPFSKPGLPPVPPMHHDHPHHCEHDHLVAVNPYNKVCFKDKEEAISILLNKDIHPGEVVFAYYYDDDVPSGINVIEAVGNLKIGARNMIFESKADIDKKINGLSVQQGDNALNIKDIKDQLEDVFNRINVLNNAINSLNDITPVVDSLVSDVEANKAMIDGHDENISVLNTSINVLADAVAEKYKEVTDSISAINDTLAEIKSDADESDNATTNAIDELKTSVETWQEQHVAEQQNQFDILDASVIKNINDVKSELNTKVDGIKGECIANTDEAVASLNQTIEELRQMVVSNNAAVDDTVADAKEDILVEIDSKINAAVDPVKSDVEQLFDSVHACEDTASELDKKYDRIIKDLSVEFDEKIENKAIDTDKKVNDFEKAIDAHKSETTSALEDLDTKLSGNIEANRSVMESAVEANTTMFRNEINTHKSAVDARFETVKSEYNTAIANAVNDLDVTIKRNANTAEKYCDNAISELRRELIAEITNRIDAIPVYSAAINGGLKCNGMGEFMLDVDMMSNIICYNGRKYILSPYDPTNIGLTNISNILDVQIYVNQKIADANNELLRQHSNDLDALRTEMKDGDKKLSEYITGTDADITLAIVNVANSVFDEHNKDIAEISNKVNDISINVLELSENVNTLSNKCTDNFNELNERIVIIANDVMQDVNKKISEIPLDNKIAEVKQEIINVNNDINDTIVTLSNDILSSANTYTDKAVGSIEIPDVDSKINEVKDELTENLFLVVNDALNDNTSKITKLTDIVNANKESVEKSVNVLKTSCTDNFNELNERIVIIANDVINTAATPIYEYVNTADTSLKSYVDGKIYYLSNEIIKFKNDILNSGED